ASIRPPARKATSQTGVSGSPKRSFSLCPVAASQRWAAPSSPAVATWAPAGWEATAYTAPPCLSVTGRPPAARYPSRAGPVLAGAGERAAVGGEGQTVDRRGVVSDHEHGECPRFRTRERAMLRRDDSGDSPGQAFPNCRRGRHRQTAPEGRQLVARGVNPWNSAAPPRLNPRIRSRQRQVVELEFDLVPERPPAAIG